MGRARAQGGGSRRARPSATRRYRTISSGTGRPASPISSPRSPSSSASRAPFAYVGWSWGESIGVHLAARHSELLTTLVLLDAGHTDVQNTPGWEELTLEERIAEWETSELSFRTVTRCSR